MTKRFDVVILGRKIGTASGWDGDLGEWYCFNDFQPSDGVNIPTGDLHFDENKGIMGLSDDAGNIIDPVDICETLIAYPKTV